MTETCIKAFTEADAVYFHVSGRATFACCTEFRDCAEKLLKGPFESIRIDLGECTGMDSTFMGVLAMMGLDRLKVDAPRVRILNAGDRSCKLLAELGIKILFDFEYDPCPDVDWLTVYPTDEMNKPQVITLESGRLMLQAHQVLMDVDEGNVGRFTDVVDSLQNDVDYLEKRKQDNS